MTLGLGQDVFLWEKELKLMLWSWNSGYLNLCRMSAVSSPAVSPSASTAPASPDVARSEDRDSPNLRIDTGSESEGQDSQKLEVKVSIEKQEDLEMDVQEATPQQDDTDEIQVLDSANSGENQVLDSANLGEKAGPPVPAPRKWVENPIYESKKNTWKWNAGSRASRTWTKNDGYQVVDLTQDDDSGRYEEIDLTGSSSTTYKAELTSTPLRVRLTKVKNDKLARDILDEPGYQLLPGFRFAKDLPVEDYTHYRRVESMSTDRTTSGSEGTTSASFSPFRVDRPTPFPPAEILAPSPSYAEVVQRPLPSASVDTPEAGPSTANPSTADESGCLGKFNLCGKGKGGKTRKGGRKMDKARIQKIPKRMEEPPKPDYSKARYHPYTFLTDRNYPRYEPSPALGRVAKIQTVFPPMSVLPAPKILQPFVHPTNLTQAPIANWLLGKVSQKDFEMACLVS